MRELRDRLQAYSDTQAANRDADGLIKEQAATTRELEARLRGLGPAGVSPAAQRAIVALEGRVRELEGEVVSLWWFHCRKAPNFLFIKHI